MYFLSAYKRFLSDRRATFSNCHRHHIQLLEKHDFSSCVFCSSENYDKEIQEVRESKISLIKVSKEKSLNRSYSCLDTMKKTNSHGSGLETR